MRKLFASAALVAVCALLVTLVSGAATAQNFQQQIAASSVLEEIPKTAYFSFRPINLSVLIKRSCVSLS